MNVPSNLMLQDSEPDVILKIFNTMTSWLPTAMGAASMAIFAFSSWGGVSVLATGSLLSFAGFDIYQTIDTIINCPDLQAKALCINAIAKILIWSCSFIGGAVAAHCIIELCLCLLTAIPAVSCFLDVLLIIKTLSFNIGFVLPISWVFIKAKTWGENQYAKLIEFTNILQSSDSFTTFFQNAYAHLKSKTTPVALDAGIDILIILASVFCSIDTLRHYLPTLYPSLPSAIREKFFNHLPILFHDLDFLSSFLTPSELQDHIRSRMPTSIDMAYLNEANYYLDTSRNRITEIEMILQDPTSNVDKQPLYEELCTMHIDISKYKQTIMAFKALARDVRNASTHGSQFAYLLNREAEVSALEQRIVSQEPLLSRLQALTVPQQIDDPDEMAVSALLLTDRLCQQLGQRLGQSHWDLQAVQAYLESQNLGTRQQLVAQGLIPFQSSRQIINQIVQRHRIAIQTPIPSWHTAAQTAINSIHGIATAILAGFQWYQQPISTTASFVYHLSQNNPSLLSRICSIDWLTPPPYLDLSITQVMRTIWSRLSMITFSLQTGHIGGFFMGRSYAISLSHYI